jgi:hypothetical protein
MAGAAIGCSNTNPLRIEPERGQVREYGIESSNKESCDVLHEDEAWSHLANDLRELKPEAAAVSFDDSFASAGNTDVLTGKSAHDAIHRSTPSPTVEGSHVSPDRRVVDASFRNTRRQNAGVFDSALHIADGASVRASDSKSGVEPADSGKQAEGT